MIESFCFSQDCRTLNVNWDNGETSNLAADMLRREARDAHTSRARMDFGEIVVSPDLSITEIHQVGRVGINLHFSDGHDRAIYPFQYLRELSDRFGK